jgi:hypothetical protein
MEENYNTMIPKVIKVRDVNLTINIYASIYIIISIILFVKFFNPRIEPLDLFLIAIPGIFGVSVFLVKNLGTFFKELFVLFSYILAAVFTIGGLGIMIANSDSPFFAPLINKIMTIILIVGSDMTFIGMANLIRKTIPYTVNSSEILVNQQNNQSDQISEFFNLNEETNETGCEFCPIHGRINSI